MASPKTGGNKKQASPSDRAYWSRAAASKFSETHREKRMARHARKMGLTKAEMESTWKVNPFKGIKTPQIIPKERMVFSGLVTDLRIWRTDADGTRYVAKMPKLIIKDGTVINVIGPRF